jgi:uncharacterized membrane protein
MRVELIHPILVHFPIALLLVGSGLKAIAYGYKRASLYPTLLFCSRLILSIGVCFAWGSVLAGELASDIVENTLCQPQVLETHSTLAYTASSLFTAGIILDWSRIWVKKTAFSKPLTILSSLLLIAGAIAIIFTGFFGGSLVFEQGAATDRQCEQASKTP